MSHTTITPQDETFLEQVVIPYFWGSLNKEQPIAIFKHDGKYLMANKKYVSLLGYEEFEEIKGRSLAQVYKYSNDSLISEVEKIQSFSREQELLVDFIFFGEYSLGIDTYLEHHYPIFSPEGKVLGSVAMIKKFQLFDLADYFLGAKPHKEKGKSESVARFSARQYEALFLLTLGYSQQEIAGILGISRWTLTKMVNERISKKLDVGVANWQDIIKISRQLRFGRHIPKSLIKPQVVTLYAEPSKTFDSN